jgi:hypothetical protein
MLNKIIIFITANELTLLIPTLLLVVVFLFGSVIKKATTPLVSLIFTLLAIGGFLVHLFEIIPNTFLLFGLPIIFFVAALILLTLLVTLIEYLVSCQQFNRRIRLIEAVPSNIETNIYAYLSKNGCLIKFTDGFNQLFSELVKNKKNWFEGVSKLTCNEEEMSFKQWMTFLKQAPETVFSLNLLLVNEETMAFNLEKKSVLVNERTIGYILINQKLTLSEVFKDTVVTDYKNKLALYFELLEEPVAYFDQEKNKYVLTNQMVRLLNAKESELSAKAFEKMIVPEDLAVLEKRP